MKKEENTRYRREKQFFLPTQGPIKTVIHRYTLFSLVTFQNSKIVLKSKLLKNVSGNWTHVTQKRIQPRSHIHAAAKLGVQ
jgi:hypothetical protein